MADKLAEAARREQETRQQLHAHPDREDLLSGNPEKLAQQWVARHTEWRRVATLLDSAAWPVYLPEQDVQGSRCARERDERRTGAVVRHAAWQQERQDARDELRTEVWLAAGPSRRLRAIAARTGLRPEQLLAQLADHVRLNDDGTLTVEPFAAR